MSKIIKITPEIFNGIIEDFKKTLGNLKMSDGKISFSRLFDVVERTAELRFTETAWLKMQALIREYDKEIGWHGIARRGESADKDEYIISDIIVYPQEVSGATVNTDQEEYQTWLYQLDDDIFNNLRMQGHSHVNMGVTPSAVDTTLYESLLSQLDDSMFYIFLIWNKRGDKTIKIYDLAKNILFETSDVKVSVICDGTGVEAILRDAKALVKERVYNNTFDPASSSSYRERGSCFGQCTDVRDYFGRYSPPNSPVSRNNASAEQPKNVSRVNQPENHETSGQIISANDRFGWTRKGKRRDF